jgi:hypothetical protein
MSRYTNSVSGIQNVTVAQMIAEYVPDSATLNGVPVTVAESGIALDDMRPGDVLIYHFNIENYKDADINKVLLKYSIEVSPSPEPAAIPLNYILSPDDACESAGDNWTYMGYGTEETHGYTLTVTWDASAIDPAYMSRQQNIQVRVNIEQVDSLS